MSRVGEVAPAASSPAGRIGRPVVLGLLALAVAVQLVVLYAPEGGGAALFPQADKVVHLLVFLVPVALALVAGFRRRVVVAVFGAQAVVSEVVQATLLPHRSGDVLDAVADLTGVALGVLAGTVVLRWIGSRAGG
ncbi:MAG: VanZ family protein [Ornithinibacter sp.]